MDIRKLPGPSLRIVPGDRVVAIFFTFHQLHPLVPESNLCPVFPSPADHPSARPGSRSGIFWPGRPGESPYNTIPSITAPVNPLLQIDKTDLSPRFTVRVENLSENRISRMVYSQRFGTLMIGYGAATSTCLMVRASPTSTTSRPIPA